MADSGAGVAELPPPPKPTAEPVAAAAAAEGSGGGGGAPSATSASAAATPASATGAKKKDVRRKDLIRELDYKWATPIEDSVYEFATIVAMVAGMAGVMFRYKIGSWIALFAVAVAFASQRSSEDVKQLMASFSFAVMGIFMNYFGRFTPPPAASGST